MSIIYEALKTRVVKVIQLEKCIPNDAVNKCAYSKRNAVSLFLSFFLSFFKFHIICKRIPFNYYFGKEVRRSDFFFPYREDNI